MKNELLKATVAEVAPDWTFGPWCVQRIRLERPSLEYQSTPPISSIFASQFARSMNPGAPGAAPQFIEVESPIFS